MLFLRSVVVSGSLQNQKQEGFAILSQVDKSESIFRVSDCKLAGGLIYLHYYYLKLMLTLHCIYAQHLVY